MLTLTGNRKNESVNRGKLQEVVSWKPKEGQVSKMVEIACHLLQRMILGEGTMRMSH